MRVRTLLLAAAVAVCSASVSVSQNRKGLQRSTTSTIATWNDKERGIVAEITNRRFTFVELYKDNVSSEENRRVLLLLEEFKSEKGFQEEGQKGTVTVQGWLGNDAAPSQKIWTIVQDGDQGAVADRFYKVTKHGCCGAEDTGVYYNLSAGRKVFTSSADLFRVEVPNTSNSLTRYVGYASAMASIPPRESESAPRVFIGAIEYGSEDGVIDRVVVKRTVKGIEDFGTPMIAASYNKKVVKGEPLELWGADKKNDPSSLSDFTMVFSFENAGSVSIPVRNDRFDLSRATARGGFAVERAK